MAHQPNLLTSATDGAVPICGQAGNPSSCLGISDRIDGAVSPETARIWSVYAVFPAGSGPRVMGVAWGLTYDGSHISIDGAWNCGDWELRMTGWPDSGSGDEVTWTNVQTSLVIPVYVFSSYTDGTPATIAIAPNPAQGGKFGDDTIPAVLDDIADYGVMGFGTSGHLSCLPAPCCHEDGGCAFAVPDDCQVPDIWRGDLAACSPNGCPQPAACCNSSTGACSITLQAGCTSPGIWHGEWTTCSPNPCPQSGACCHPRTGACVMTIQAQCRYPMAWHGDWTSCAPNPCLGLSAGACCNLLTCYCSITADAVTCTQGGAAYRFQGAGVTCNPDPCSGAGACCLPTGICQILSCGQCLLVSPGGFYGPGTVCVPTPCPVSGVPQIAAGSREGWLDAVPNPFMTATLLWYRLPEAGPAHLEIFDAAGRQVGLSELGQIGAGIHSLEWDGRSSGGDPVAPGVYFARLSAGGHCWTRALVRIK